MDREKLSAQLTLNEGLRLKPYRCTAGKLTIGIGRNLDDRGISADEAKYLLANDIKSVEADLDRNLPWWRDMSETRQRVLADMCFNLGIGYSGSGLLSFHTTLRLMKSGDYESAADAMMNSIWFKQVGARAVRLVEMMRKGEDENGI